MNTKISKRDAGLLLLLGGALGFLALYMLVFLPFQEKTDAANQQVAALEAQVSELEAQYLHLAEYEQGIEDYRASVTDRLTALPAQIREEDLLSYLLTLQARTGIKLDSVSFNGSALLEEFPAVVSQDGTELHTTMDACTTGAVFTGQLSYPQMKSVLRYLYTGTVQTSLNSVAVSFNAETGGLSGNFDISRYYVSYPEATYVPEPLPTMDLGVADLFGTT